MSRYIQAWTHDGSPHTIHAIADDPGQRERMGLGRLGIFAVRACDRRKPFPHGRFMRLVHSNDDQPTYTDDGWLDSPGQAGLDWGADLRSILDHRCEGCVRAMRKQATV